MSAFFTSCKLEHGCLVAKFSKGKLLGGAGCRGLVDDGTW